VIGWIDTFEGCAAKQRILYLGENSLAALRTRSEKREAMSKYVIRNDLPKWDVLLYITALSPPESAVTGGLRRMSSMRML
jgi:hypothetical protein